MAGGLLKRLSEQRVPPTPEAFDSELNNRLNDRLLFAQLLDLFCRAIPYTCLEFSRAVIGFVIVTFTGLAPGDRRRRR